MTNPYKSFFKNLLLAVLMAIAIVLMLIGMSSCKLFKEVKKDSSDSARVVKQTETAIKVDTSKSKTETASTKETIYYPQPIYVQGKDGETKVIFVPQSTKETGSKTEENTNAIFEQFKKDFSDSLNSIKNSKQTDTKIKVGLSTFEIIILCAFGLILLKMFAPSVINLLTKK